MASPEKIKVIRMKTVLLTLTLLLVSAPAPGKLDQSLEEIEKLIRLRDYSQAVSRLQVVAEKGDPEPQGSIDRLWVQKNQD